LRFHERTSFPARLLRRELLLGLDPAPAPVAGEITPAELEDGIKLDLMPGGILWRLEDCPRSVEGAARARIQGKATGLHPSWVDAVPRECKWATGNNKVPGCGRALWDFAVKQTLGLGILDGHAAWQIGFATIMESLATYFRTREILKDRQSGTATAVKPRRADANAGRSLLLVAMTWTAVLLALAVFFFSWLPQPQLSTQVPMPGKVAHWVDGPANWNLRTAVPFLFMGLVCGIRFALQRRATAVWAFAWVAMVFIATVAEIGQLFIPHRKCDAGDIAWAAAGSATGLGVVAVCFVTAVVLRELRGLQALRS
jgi:hypothetical protein